MSYLLLDKDCKREYNMVRRMGVLSLQEKKPCGTAKKNGEFFMKKRILALAMTLVMVFSSMAALSTVSFAADDHEDCLHFDESWPTVPAYRATVKVDGTGQNSEPYIMVQEWLNNVRYGLAWDYENVYLVLYNYGVNNDAKYSSIEFTIGGTEYKVAGSTITGGLGGAKAAQASNVYFEIAIPLAEIKLHFTPETVYAPLALKVVSNKGTDVANVNVELTGRTLIRRNTAWDGAQCNGYGTNDHLYVATMASNSGIYTLTSTADGAWAGFIHKNMNEMIDARAGGAYYVDYDIKLEDLPTLTTDPVKNDIKARAYAMLGVQIHFNGIEFNTTFDTATGKNAGMCALVYKFEDAQGNISVKLAVNTQNSFKIITLEDASVGTSAPYFNLGFQVDRAGLTVKVDEKYVDFMPGYLNYNKVFNGNGSTSSASVGIQVDSDSDTAKAYVRNSVYATVYPVDFEALKALTDGNDATTTKQNIVAGLSITTESDFANVGSLAKVFVGVDPTAEALDVKFTYAGLSKITFNFGGDAIVVDITKDSFYPKFTATGMNATLTFDRNDPNFAYLSIPLKNIAVNTDGAVLTTDMTVTAEKTWKANVDRAQESTKKATVDVEIAYILSYDVSKAATIGKTFNATLTGDGAGVAANQQGPIVNGSWTASGNLTSNLGGVVNDVYNAATKSFTYDITVMDMTGVDYSGIVKNTSGTNTINTNAVAGQTESESRLMFTTNFGSTGVRYKDVATSGAYSALNKPPLNTAPGYALNNITFMLYNVTSGVDSGKEGFYVAISKRTNDNLGTDGGFTVIYLGETLDTTNGTNLKITYEVNFADKSATIYCNGVECGTTPYGLFVDNESRGLWTGEANKTLVIPVRGFKQINGAVPDATYNYTINSLSFGATSIEFSNAEFLTMTKNTNFDQPEVTDPEEMIELYAVQNKGKASDEDYAQRLVATIDTLDYKYAGFQIAVANNGDFDVDTYRVYDANTSILDGDEATAVEGKYFITYTLDDAGEFISGTAYVRAFAVDANRKYVYGDTYKVTVDSNGVLASAEIVVNPDIFN